MRTLYAAAGIAALTLLTVGAMGLGSDYGREKIGGNDRWPPGLADIVNAPERVHGFWVNDADVFYFAGDSAAANAMLTKVAAFKGASVSVVLHGGRSEIRSPWDKEPRDGKADWVLRTESRMARVKAAGDEAKLQPATATAPAEPKLQITLDLYVGGGVDLAKLKMPKELQVIAGDNLGDSKQAIEDFVTARKTAAEK